MDNLITVRFYEELNFFLPREKRKKDFIHILSEGQTTKDMIESEGIPHTEVDLILVNGKSAGFDYLLESGERVSVYPVFERLDITGVTKLGKKPLREPKFVLDVHLHRLAVKMRLLGLDVDYEPGRDDPELAEISVRTGRILLTRDRQLLMRRIVTHGLYVHNMDPAEQIKEVVEKLELGKWLNPFSRCSECNGLLYPVVKGSREYEDVRQAVPPKVREFCTDFSRCGSCGKIYWEGSHMDKIRAWMEELLTDTSGDTREE